MTTSKREMELLYKNLRRAPNREWLNSYLDLVKRFLDATHIKNDDERLDMSFSAKSPTFLSVTVNWRFVIAAENNTRNKKSTPSVSLLLKSNYRDFPELRDNSYVIRQGKFGNLPNEETKPPVYLLFTDLPELIYLLDTKHRIYDFWVESISEEINRAEASPSRDAHQPLFYKLVTDKKFRAATLDDFYSDRMNKADVFPDEVNEPQEFIEGATYTVSVNAYERNAKARRICIVHYGLVCSVCGMNFKSRYGSVGEGFIHVHHLKPLGNIGKEYKIDPIEDLRPVCPNCHAVLHMRNPPYSISEVKAMYKK